MGRLEISITSSGRRRVCIKTYYGGTTIDEIKHALPIRKQRHLIREFERVCNLLGRGRQARKSGLKRGVYSAPRINRKIKDFGYKLFRTLYPRVKEPTLEDLVGEDEFLELCLDTDSRIYPWELAFDGERFLCTEYCVGRTTLVKNLVYLSDFNLNSDRALVIGLNYEDYRDDLDCLDYCRSEARNVARQLERLGFRAELYLDENATKSNIISELKTGVAILHFTGHADFRKRSTRPRSGRLCLSDVDLTTRDLEGSFEKNGAPFFSFINGCESGRELSAVEIWEPHRGMASAFLRHGAGIFVGSFWPIDDEPSKDVSLNFYKQLAKRRTIGEAMKRTRLFCKLRRSQAFRETWPAYVLYGDPNKVFPLP